MESHFQFNGKYYDQVDGVAMSSPLGPLFVNIFMDEFESKNMKTLKELGVSNWSRYVDDVFSIIKNKELAQQILDFFNKQHKNIKFTIEKSLYHTRHIVLCHDCGRKRITLIMPTLLQPFFSFV
jgi:hypothetical protein